MAYHAGLESELRQRIQQQFMQGEVPCIVATIAFGMGIDKADIRRVVHYDLPKSMKTTHKKLVVLDEMVNRLIVRYSPINPDSMS